MSKVTLHDGAAAAVAIILALGAVGAAMMGRPIPAEISGAFLLSLGWLFRGGLERTNGYMNGRNRTGRRSGGNDSW